MSVDLMRDLMREAFRLGFEAARADAHADPEAVFADVKRHLAERQSWPDVMRSGGDAAGPGRFLVGSQSRPGHWWTIEIGADGTTACQCPAGERGQRCRHIERAEHLIRHERERNNATAEPDLPW